MIYRSSTSHICAVFMIFLSTFAIRYSSFWLISLNPDESEFFATAAYALDSGRTEFQFHTITFTVTVYRFMSILFGPYCIWEFRVVIALLSGGVASLVYGMLCRSGCCWSASALGGMLFVTMSPLFEGLACNSENLSIVPLTLAICLYLEVIYWSRWKDIGLILIGILLGLSIMAKEQALPLTFALPATSIWRGVHERRWGVIRELVAMGVGGGLAILCYVSPFLVAGTLEEHLTAKLSNVKSYALKESVPWNELLSSYIRNFYLELFVMRNLLLMTLIFSISWMGSQVLDTLKPRDRDPLSRKKLATILASLFFLASLYTIQIGQRFFLHYFLFAVPTWALLFGLVADRVYRWARFPTSNPWISCFVGLAAVLICVDCSSSLGPAVLLVLSITWLAGWWLVRDYRISAVTSFLILSPIALSVPYLIIPMSEINPAAQVATRQFSDRFNPDDRLFVWGWMPAIYCYSRLTPATQYTVLYRLARDWNGNQLTPDPDKSTMHDFLQQLRNRPPRFIIDSGTYSYTMSKNKSLYLRDNFPEFDQFLQSHYVIRDRYTATQLVLFSGESKTYTIELWERIESPE